MAASFDPVQFMQELETCDDLESNDQAVSGLRRVDLKVLAKHLELKVNSNAKKGQFLEMVVYDLSERDLVSEMLVESLDVSVVTGGPDIKTESVEARKLELEAQEKMLRIRHEQELEKLKAEAEIKERLANARAIEANGFTDSESPRGSMRRDEYHFDASRHVKMVPQFQDKDLDAYFTTFEHTASTLNWPKDKWSILLSTTLRGRAQITYAALEPIEKLSYDRVKIAILEAYELVPESYRMSFRNSKKGDKQTYTEFAKDKERLFDKWCRSRKVDDFEGLKNLMLMEDFKLSCPKDLRTHLDDLDIQDIHVAARKADDYTITHKLSGSSSGFGSKWSTDQNQAKKDRGPYSAQSSAQRGQNQGQGQGKTWCSLHRSSTHSSEQCKVLQSMGNKGGPQERPVSVTATPYKQQKRKESSSSGKKVQSSDHTIKPVGLTHVRATEQKTVHTSANSTNSHSPRSLELKSSIGCTHAKQASHTMSPQSYLVNLQTDGETTDRFNKHSDNLSPRSTTPYDDVISSQGETKPDTDFSDDSFSSLDHESFSTGSDSSDGDVGKKSDESGDSSDSSDDQDSDLLAVDNRFLDFVSVGYVQIDSTTKMPSSEWNSNSNQSVTSMMHSSTNVVALDDVSDEPKRVHILRDTGSSQSLLLSGILNLTSEDYTGKNVLISGVCGQTLAIPLYRVVLQSGLVSPGKQVVEIGLTSSLPVEGVQVLIGNDLAGSKVQSEPVVSDSPMDSHSTEILESQYGTDLPSCVVTRAMKRAKADAHSDESSLQNGTNVAVQDGVDDIHSDVNLSDTFMYKLGTDLKDFEFDLKGISGTSSLIEAQQTDPEFQSLIQSALDSEEAEKVPSCYLLRDGLLLRKWRGPLASAGHDCETKYQVVLPQFMRAHVLELGHDAPMSGHLGVRKTKARIFEHFWWPGAGKAIAEYVKTCHTCQMVGKPNQGPKKVPLRPIPVMEEPFARILVDIVGPLPRAASGHQYILTIMCTATRFPECIALRSCTAKAVTQALLRFFTQVGLPLIVHSDRGTHFTAKVLNQVLEKLGIDHVYGCAYRPQSQGAIERFHQTLKSMIKMYVFEHEKDWDVGLPFLVFAARDSVQESLGFTPFELVYGHHVRGPLKLLKDKCFDDRGQDNVITYVSKMKQRLHDAVQVAHKNLMVSQEKMKETYDIDTVSREFKVGDSVLVLLPVPGNPLQVTYVGPCTVLEAVDGINYVVSTPGRRKKTQLCHVNMLKAYHSRANILGKSKSDDIIPDVTLNVTSDKSYEGGEETQPEGDFEVTIQPVKLGNSQVLNDLDSKLSHLTQPQANELKALLNEYKDLFPDVPGRAEGMYHDVDVGDARPIKQHPYRVNPVKREIMKAEVEYMLENKIIEPCTSEWSSPCILQPKPGNAWRFCTDFRKVNAVTKTDSFPLPRIEDLIDEVGHANFVTKLDLLKGYWQIPLTERAKDISSFCIGDGLYRYLVCPFGMKNSGCTFQRFMNMVISGLDSVRVYVDDIIIYTNTWSKHMDALKALFDRLRYHKLTVNLVKSEFSRATVQYLGHIVGHGRILPVSAKVQAVLDLPVPENKKAVLRLIGLCAFYRRFLPNLSTVISPLTDLVSKARKFEWSQECQEAFEKVKRILVSPPVLISPDYTKEFRLYCDSSDVGVGASLMQCDKEGVEHPVGYYSKKLNKHQRNYATVEKEALSLLLAVKHYEVYLSASPFPVQVFTDHNPLTFIHRMKTDNQRLLRWSLTLQEYNLNIHHVKGSDNLIADALSRA